VSSKTDQTPTTQDQMNNSDNQALTPPEKTNDETAAKALLADSPKAQ